MTHFSKHFSAAMLAVGIMLAAVPVARADTTCPPDPVTGSTVNGNLIVTSGAICQLSDVTVTGNVQVQTNAFLSVNADSTGTGTTIDGNLHVGAGATLASATTPRTMTVDGNIEADQCNNVDIEGDKVAGNVDIQNCFTGLGFSQILVGHTEIAGNFNCSNNSVDCILSLSSVKGNVQINNNQSEAVVYLNTIDGNLLCQGNALGVQGAKTNNIAGLKRGQCVNF